jgi:hypothetical protein
MTQIKHAFFILIAIASLFFTWPHAIDWVRGGGNILNPLSFFVEPYKLGGTSAFLTMDIAVVWIAYLVWVVPDAKRIGLGAKWGWIFFALSYLGTCFAFPLYLVMRERHLDRQGARG